MPVIPHVYRVAINHKGSSGVHTTNVIHVRMPDDPSEAGVIATLDAQAGTNNLFGPVASGYASAGTTLAVTKLDGVSPTVESPVTATAWDCAGSGDPVPEAALGLTLRTAKRGRSFRGRLFIGPLTEAAINNGIVSSSIVTGLSSSWSTFATDIAGAGTGYALVVASYHLSSAENVTNVEGHFDMRTQRQRLLRTRT
jgi:hypothetical protein